MLIELSTKQELIVVGLMSGTSLDGVDSAIVRIGFADGSIQSELLHFSSYAYDKTLREKIKSLCSKDQSDVASLCAMNAILAERFAQAVLDSIAKAGIAVKAVDLISSHGQTVWHQPKAEPGDPFSAASTLQIGDLSVLSKRTGLIVVGDFRTADMAVGGQGAPLTPVADYFLLKHPTKGRIIQNIGGIGNCTVIRADAHLEDVTAFDTGPGNMLIDQAVQLLYGNDTSYDEGGKIAAAGSVDRPLLERMLAHPYFKQPPVKTTGREMFGKDYALHWLQEANSVGLRPEDIVATFTALTAESIARSYADFVLPHGRYDEVIVCGGGAHNVTLMRMLEQLLPSCRIFPLEQSGASSDAREAVAFALLGFLFIHGKANNLPSVTGAKLPTVMGKLALP